MHKDWFPFFSMLFWFTTKVTGLALLMSGLMALMTMMNTAFSLMGLVSSIALLAAGWVLLSTEVLFDLGSAEMRRRLGAPK
jgi:hypothetical protein